MTRETTPVPRTRIVAPSGEKMASDYDMTEGATRTLKSTGAAADALSENVIERVGEMALDSEHTKMMAFMNERVRVRIGTSTDPNAEQVFELIVNGKTELFKRGETKTVPRYYVDLLARLKETGFENKEVINRDGERSYAYVPRTALKYDFAVVGESNPLGDSWLAHVIAEQG